MGSQWAFIALRLLCLTAAVGAYVASAFNVVGMGQENSLASHPAGDLHAPVVVILVR